MRVTKYIFIEKTELSPELHLILGSVTDQIHSAFSLILRLAFRQELST